jgi:Tat protein translocase TatB subunit
VVEKDTQPVGALGMTGPGVVLEHAAIDHDAGALRHREHDSRGEWRRELTLRGLFPTLAAMFGIGMPELIVILVVALVVLGPQRLPEVARTLGKALAEFRRQTADIVDEFQVQTLLEDERRPPAKPAPPPAAAPAATATPSPTAPPTTTKPDAGEA